jgi:hypothetical protein
MCFWPPRSMYKISRSCISQFFVYPGSGHCFTKNPASNISIASFAVHQLVVLLNQLKRIPLESTGRIPRAIAICLLVQNDSDDQKLSLLGTTSISSCVRLCSTKLRLAMLKCWLLCHDGRHSGRSNQTSRIRKVNSNVCLQTRIHWRCLWKCSATMQPSRAQMPQWSSL